MTGFFGQRFDFTGNDNGWYALISDPPTMQINMRVTVPVPSVPETTYITGFSVLTTDDDGLDHSIVVAAKTPHNMYTACPVGVSPCLADGSLTVLLDGKGSLAAPGTVSLAPGIDITAVNIPGECRSFGFKAYWEKKKEDNAAYWTKMEQEGARDSRKLSATLGMGEWILDNPTATNMVDCADYVARSAEETGGLFAHQSEHASFRIVTPGTTIRLSHGKRYEVAVQDPMDTTYVPDSTTWQMNIGIDHTDVSNDAKGILGETMVPTRDGGGDMIMHGKRYIRGEKADCKFGADIPKGIHPSARVVLLPLSGIISKYNTYSIYQGNETVTYTNINATTCLMFDVLIFSFCGTRWSTKTVHVPFGSHIFICIRLNIC